MISVCILTKNCASTLSKTLASVQSFDEVLLLDNGSTDATLQIAKTFPNVKIHETSFKGFGMLRNEAAQLAKNDWILQLDSDETLSSSAVEELHRLVLDAGAAYRFQRHNFYQGKRIIGCGWGNDSVVRLYHRGRCRYKEVSVHEALDTRGVKEKWLQFPIEHTPYRSPADFLQKQELYSTLFAQEQKGKKRGSLLRGVSSACFSFLKGYVFQGGFLSGAAGFTIARYNAATCFQKYKKLKKEKK